jgi:hypothetical protein
MAARRSARRCSASGRRMPSGTGVWPAAAARLSNSCTAALPARCDALGRAIGEPRWAGAHGRGPGGRPGWRCQSARADARAPLRAPAPRPLRSAGQSAAGRWRECRGRGAACRPYHGTPRQRQWRARSGGWRKCPWHRRKATAPAAVPGGRQRCLCPHRRAPARSNPALPPPPPREPRERPFRQPLLHRGWQEQVRVTVNRMEAAHPGPPAGGCIILQGISPTGC